MTTVLLSSWFKERSEPLKKALKLENVLYGQQLLSAEGFLLGEEATQQLLPYNNCLVLKRNLKKGNEFFVFSRALMAENIQQEYAVNPAIFDHAVFYLREKIATAMRRSFLNHKKLTTKEIEFFQRWRKQSIFTDEPSQLMTLHSDVQCRRYYLYGDNQTSYVTARELDYLRLLVKGFRVASIAKKLSVSAYTVDAQFRNIKRRLGCQTIIEVVHLLHQKNLLMMQ